MAITNPLDTIDVTFTLPREAWTNPDGILDAFADQYGWKERIASDDVANLTFDPVTKTVLNPITKEQHAINCVQDYVEEIWAAHVYKMNVANTRTQVKVGLDATRAIMRTNTKTKVVK